jgi:hypothetical protein
MPEGGEQSVQKGLRRFKRRLLGETTAITIQS